MRKIDENNRKQTKLKKNKTEQDEKYDKQPEVAQNKKSKNTITHNPSNTHTRNNRRNNKTN